jgi:hypothetical protein
MKMASAGPEAAFSRKRGEVAGTARIERMVV